jgi:hypothetical protein
MYRFNLARTRPINDVASRKGRDIQFRQHPFLVDCVSLDVGRQDQEQGHSLVSIRYAFASRAIGSEAVRRDSGR